MELALLVYGVSLLGNVNGLLAFICFVCLIGVFVSSMLWNDTWGSKETKLAAKLWFKRFIWSGVVAVLLFVTLPSTKTAYIMMGAYAAQKVAEDPKVQVLSGKVLKIIEQKLDEALDEQTKKDDKWPKLK